MDNSVDIVPDMGYNSNNDDNVEIVKMDEQSAINDPNCEHELVKDPTDRIGNCVAYMCVKPMCGYGQFLPDDDK